MIDHSIFNGYFCKLGYCPEQLKFDIRYSIPVDLTSTPIPIHYKKVDIFLLI